MDDKTKALVDAAKCALRDQNVAGVPTWPTKLSMALAAFEPEVEYEYVLPEIGELLPEIDRWFGGTDLTCGQWHRLRELTKRRKGREFWLLQSRHGDMFMVHDSKAKADDYAKEGNLNVIHVREVPNE